MANEFVAKNGLISQNDSTVSGSLTVATTATSPFQVLSGSTSLLYVSSSGRIGIGTTSPGATIHSSGTSETFWADRYTNTPALILRRANGTSSSPTSVIINDGLGVIGFRGYGATGFSAGSKAGVLAYAAENWTDAAQGTYMIFSTTSTGSTTLTERLRIKDNGYIGIGTNSPNSILDISGSLNISGSGVQAPLQVWSGSTSLLYVSASGNVGIGTSTPNSKLNVIAGTLTDLVGAMSLSATMPSVITGTNIGVLFDITSSGSSSFAQTGLQTYLNAGYTGPQTTTAVNGINNAAGTGSAIFGARNQGAFFSAAGTTTGTNVGVYGSGANGNINYGSFGRAIAAKNSSTNIGVAGLALNSGTSTIQVGGYFGLQNVDPTFTSAALMCDNGSEASDIFVARDSGSSIFKIFDGGNTFIGSSPTDGGYKLDVNGTGRFTSNFTVTGYINASSQFINTGNSTPSALTYKLTNAGGASTPKLIMGALAATSGNKRIFYDETNELMFGVGNSGGTMIARAAIQVSGSNNTTGSEAGDLIFLTQTGGTAISEKMRIRGNSSILFTSSFTSTTTSQSYFQITGSITQVQTASAQIYGVNITPTMVFTTGSQTQTALRVAPTFSGSAALTSSQNNIIADFGATSVGTQFSVNDITSGSIYMVNDVSGLPILEATSDWTVNMYNYPTKVFQKTGSAIIISGSLTVVTGSSIELQVTNTGVRMGNATTDNHNITGSLNLSGSSAIIGALAIGTSSLGSTENTLVVGPPPSGGGTGEGGQILLQASGGLYTSASMIDTYQDKFRILKGTNVSSNIEYFNINLDTGQLALNNYDDAAAFTGTAVASLAVDASGNVLTSDLKGYTISAFTGLNGTTFTPANGATYYFGNQARVPTSSATIWRLFIPRTGTIKRADFISATSATGTGENISLYIRLNNTTDTLVATVGNTSNPRLFQNANLSIAVQAGEYIEMKLVCPTWVTQPTGFTIGGQIYIE